MKKIIFLLMSLFFFGCSDAADNPTSPANYQTVPEPVLQVISNSCTFCHQPEPFSIAFKGQKPYFGIWIPDGNATILDKIQIWQSKERIGIRVAEGTMPRISDTVDPTDTTQFFFPLSDDQFKTIVDWAQGE